MIFVVSHHKRSGVFCVRRLPGRSHRIYLRHCLPGFLPVETLQCRGQCWTHSKVQFQYSVMLRNWFWMQSAFRMAFMLASSAAFNNNSHGSDSASKCSYWVSSQQMVTLIKQDANGQQAVIFRPGQKYFRKAPGDESLLLDLLFSSGEWSTILNIFQSLGNGQRRALTNT